MNTLFQNILTASFHGSIVIAAVLVLRLVLRKTPKKFICYLWMLAVLRLLMPFQIQSTLSLQPETPPMPGVRWVQPDIRQADGIREYTVEEAENAPQPMQAERANVRAAALQPQHEGVDWMNLIPFLWAAVGLGIIAVSVISYLHLKRQVWDAVKIPGGWESEHIETAFVLGFIRPQIYIPMGMTKTTRNYILAHERTHMEKGDQWFKVIGFLALALHWFNPLVWLAYILLCKDIEMACDERVVQFMELDERKAYSAALLNCSTNRVHYAACPVAFGEVSVKYRIQSVLNYRKPSFWISLLGVIAIVFVTVCLVTSPTGNAGSTAKEKPESFTASQCPPMEEEMPDWHIQFTVDAVSTTAAKLYCGPDEEWDGTPTKVWEAYSLERWTGSQWLPVTKMTSDPPYTGDYSIMFCQGEATSTICLDVDWGSLYGALPEGDYRMVKNVERYGTAAKFYAWFHIYTNTLTGDEAVAYQRCVNSLYIVKDAPNYACDFFASNEQGELLKNRSLQKNRVDLLIEDYLGEFKVNSAAYEFNWDVPFRIEGNKRIVFPKGDSTISEQEIKFHALWSELDGTENHQICTYTFDTAGQLSGVDILTMRAGQEETTASRKRVEIHLDPQSYFTRTDALEYEDSFTAQNKSPWNLHFRVDDDYLTPTGGEIWLSINAVGVSKYSTDGSFWLEKKDGDRWNKLTPLQEPVTWGDETYTIQSRTTTINVDWSAFYGKLDRGVYRMGKSFSNGSETMIQFAEFAISQVGGIYGQGGEEAIARYAAAVDKLSEGNYCIEECNQTYNPLVSGIVLQPSARYWKYDGVFVDDVCWDGVIHHSYAWDNPDEYLYELWKTNIGIPESPYNSIYFPTGMSTISDREIRFQLVYSNQMAGFAYEDVTASFAEDGSLERITKQFVSFNESGEREIYTIELTVQNVPESEIRDYVNKIQSKTAHYGEPVQAGA